MLRIYNTMSRKKEEFKPRDSDCVKIFTCGPSIYQKAHLGNYRTFLYEDILVRYLIYKGFNVVRSMNLTDIEDKAIKEAKKKKTNVKSLTNIVLYTFQECLKDLNILPPTHLVPATESVEQAVNIIKKLTNDGIAYEYNGDYFFDPLKIKDFGKLFRLDMSRWPQKKIRYKKDTYNGNRWNLGDFILWHKHKNNSTHPFWDTDIGKGRPSWNIQDPSIVTMTLGQQIDINCGGIDNIYRHHDYNIAVMEAYTKKEYSKYYMHGAHLIVNGKSMSKSKGNIIYPEDLVKKGIDLRDLRFFLINTHYRKQLNFTEKNLNRAISIIREFRNNLKAIKIDSSTHNKELNMIIKNLDSCFSIAMDDDLCVGGCFNLLNDSVKKIYNTSKTHPISELQFFELNNSLKKIDKVLKLIYPIY